MKREMTCICCPIGCTLCVEDSPDGLRVTGNGCPRGDKYARTEAVSPRRTVTGTVAVRGGDVPRLSVKTAGDIPKSTIFDCMRAVHGVAVDAPVAIGDVILENVAGTGVDLVATKAVARAEA